MSKAEKTKKREGGSGKQAPGKRRSYFMLNPFTELVVIGLDTKDGPEHPTYDERILIPFDPRHSERARKLCVTYESIKKYGVKEAVKFKRDGDRNIIAEGRQRIRCARKATLELRAEGKMKPNQVMMVPAIPWQGSDRDLYVLARNMNASRVDNDDEANAKEARQMLGWGISEAEVAETMGVTPQTIKAWQALLSATPTLRAAHRRGAVPATAAAKLAKLPSAEQGPALAKLLESGGKPTVAAAMNVVREANGKAPIESPSSRIKAALAALDELRPELVNGWPITAQTAVKALRDILAPRER